MQDLGWSSTPKRLLRMCKVVALVFRPTKINKQILKAYCFHVAAELETVTPTSCYSSSRLYSLLHPETSTRSEVCISPVWSLRADSWGAPCVKVHLTRDGESTQAASQDLKEHSGAVLAVVGCHCTLWFPQHGGRESAVP